MFCNLYKPKTVEKGALLQYAKEGTTREKNIKIIFPWVNIFLILVCGLQRCGYSVALFRTHLRTKDTKWSRVCVSGEAFVPNMPASLNRLPVLWHNVMPSVCVWLCGNRCFRLPEGSQFANMRHYNNNGDARICYEACLWTLFVREPDGVRLSRACILDVDESCVCCIYLTQLQQPWMYLYVISVSYELWLLVSDIPWILCSAAADESSCTRALVHALGKSVTAAADAVYVVTEILLSSWIASEIS